jgi:Fe-S-cluster containining protein
VPTPLRIDPAQRFACSQCGRCCRGFDVVVTASEIDLYRRRIGAGSLGGVEASDLFEPVPGAPSLQRIRKRAGGACVFLSEDNRCRIHQELGAAKKPLTCRLFPYSLHAAADGVVVKASFNCPTVVANEGALIGAGPSRVTLESLRDEWLASRPSKAPALELVKGRSMTPRTLLLLRQHFLEMLMADGNDLRSGLRRIGTVLDDLTRRRVRALADRDFAEYVALTVPHAAGKAAPPPTHGAGAVTRLLQHGFLYAVTATRDAIAHPDQSRTASRLRRLRLLAHFHGLSPGFGGVNVAAVNRLRPDINDDQLRPVAFRYLRATLETLGAEGRPVVEELATAVSFLNAACALAAMNAEAARTTVDRKMFIRAITEASDVSHTQHKTLHRILAHFSGGSDALRSI